MLNAFPGECNYKYLICDNNRLFQTAFENDVKDLLGLKVRKIARFSPWMNGVTERTVGSIRRELLDHVMVLNEHHLNALLKKYKDYYNSARTHLKLDKDAPDVRPQEFQSESGNRITEKVFLGGLHHRYSWAS